VYTSRICQARDYINRKVGANRITRLLALAGWVPNDLDGFQRQTWVGRTGPRVRVKSKATIGRPRWFASSNKYELAAVLPETHQVRVLVESGQLEHEVAWHGHSRTTPLKDLQPGEVRRLCRLGEAGRARVALFYMSWKLLDVQHVSGRGTGLEGPIGRVGCSCVCWFVVPARDRPLRTARTAGSSMRGAEFGYCAREAQRYDHA
jgi:hypothetical protein